MSSIIGSHLNLNGTYANTIYTKTTDNGFSKENDKITSYLEFSSSNNITLFADNVVLDDEQLKWRKFSAENNGSSEMRLAVGNPYTAKTVDELQLNDFTLNSTGAYTRSNNSIFFDFDEIELSSSLSKGLNDTAKLNIDFSIKKLALASLPDDGFYYGYDEVNLLAGTQILNSWEKSGNVPLISFLPLRDINNGNNYFKFLKEPSFDNAHEMIYQFCEPSVCEFSSDNGRGEYSNNRLIYFGDNSTPSENTIYQAYQIYRLYNLLYNKKQGLYMLNVDDSSNIMGNYDNYDD